MARRPSRRGKRRGIAPPRRSLEHYNLATFKWFLSEHINLPDGHGKMVLEPHEEDALEDLFAGCPMLVLLWPTGSRKSTLIAALALFIATYVKRDPRIFIIGGLGKHGRNALDAAIRFVHADRRLSAWWEPQEYLHGRLKSRIPGDMGEILVVSAGRRVGERGGSTVEGELPDAIFVEELHRHEDDGSAVATLITKAQKKSVGGWVVPCVVVTTAGASLKSYLGRLVRRAMDSALGGIVTRNPDRGPFYRRGQDADGDLVVHEYAVPNEIQPPEPPASGEAEEQKRWREELNAYLQKVILATPVSWATIANLRRSFKANLTTPWVFQRQHCNQWVVQTLNALDRVGWARGRRLGFEIPRGAEGVVVGLDTSAKWDATALVPVWIDPATKETCTSGATILVPKGKTSHLRKKHVFDIVASLAERYPDLVVAFDENYGGGLIAEQLEEDLGIRTVNVGTGKPFELASMRLAELIADGNLIHDGHEELTEHVVSAAARPRPGNDEIWRLDKPDGGNRIDGAAALANAVWIAHNPPADRQKAAPGVDFWG